MLTFTAILVSDVIYSDFNGDEVRVPEGTPVLVSRAPEDTVSVDVDGHECREGGAFFATREGVTFDVTPGDFERVHLC